MKKTVLLLSCAVGLTLASCSQNKTEDTTAADGATTTTTTTTTSYSEDAIQRRADRMAADMAAKMKLDEATRTKIRTVYVTRGQRIGELQQKYASDTTGMAAAMRDVYASSDAEMKSVFTNPGQYTAYESSRTEYMDDRYMDDDVTTASAGMDSSMDNSSMSTSTSNMSAGASSERGTDGKIKIKRDGDIKLKDSEGNKAKIDADDATIKIKPENGGKTVIK